MTDFDVLEMVRRELDVDFSNGVTLAGIVYLYPITMMRFAKTSDRNKIMLSNLCGKDALQKTLLVTSCWNAVPSQLPADLAISREEKLRGTGAYWADLIAHNARVDRFDESQAAAYHIVDRVLHWKSYQDPGSFPHLRFEMAWQRKPSKDASVVAEEVERLLAERREYFEEKGEELRRDEDNQVTSQQEEHRRNVRQAEAEQDQSRRRQHSQVLDDISAEEREFDRLSTLLSGEEIKSRNRREAEAEELVYVNADVKDLDKQIEATDKSIAKTKARYQGGRPSKKRR
ncbi:uncharacterized protein HMPREF1541_10497 [Cyphellophora europaea CBS 101466]|uniref:Uncharacterized protein n=1 Tax=Cyphellophora europaea (strain CBS 101466) TaxID=1220924 RepID=W2S6K6_CYPE1|nr:uncharacterized protein HMPREF1541_10497 [Cyphellophora europaea CBS 101466]ETN44317.1 hypothetical protein HMPREF1541_10497 [Cyphellophora europaea CBS 101466]